MDHILTIVEQLDRASRELRNDHPINNRLALILIDNAAELIIHDKAQFYLRYDKDFPRLTGQQRKAAGGNYFDDKAKLLESLGDLSFRERQFVEIAHEYRNELYHVGLNHEGIIRALAIVYSALVCVIFNRLQPGIISWYTNQRFTKIAESYLPRSNGALNLLGFNYKTLAIKIAKRFSRFRADLQGDLATNANRKIDAIEQNLDFIVEDNPSRMPPAEVLRAIQYSADFSDRLTHEGVIGHWTTPGYLENVKRVRSEFEKDWRQRYKRVSFKNWRTRAAKIGHERDPYAALAHYQALCSDMEYLERAISEAALQLDVHIQLQIDMARGK